MPLEVLLTSDRFESDPAGRELLEAVSAEQLKHATEHAVYYYDFPTYSDYEAITHTPSALLLSPKHGILAIRAIGEFQIASGNFGGIADIQEGISEFCSILIGRLLKSRILRKNVSQLTFPVTPILFAPAQTFHVPENAECRVFTSREAFVDYLFGVGADVIDANQLAEARSVVEGAKALVRPIKRTVQDPAIQRAAAALVKLESEIANFDQKQRRAALSTVPGPQRIRGLAGSGKTVILAMKAAHLHLTNPSAKILVTFFTKSLRDTIRSLITKFYRHYKEADPDWNSLHVRHGWGGTNKHGVYADACRRAGVPHLPFSEAKLKAVKNRDPFDTVCQLLVDQNVAEQYYDYVLIDEGQDFPSSFYMLAHQITKGKRDRKNIVWAYDELQNILDVKIRSPEELFGSDETGSPRVSLDRAAQNLPKGAENDMLLSKCYRNQREILVVAHALGFGIYNEIVQMLESAEHWEDVGYKVLKGDLTKVGSDVRINRPAENSPLSLDNIIDFPLIEIHVASDFTAECHWAALQVQKFVAGGLNPQDIMIISLDDRAARSYFKRMSEELALAGLSSHNLLGDPYSDPPFFIEGKVTLSTIYKAKGNEAPAVVVLGIDGTSRRTRSGRNKIFTAFTRSKAWLRASGVGTIAAGIKQEVDTALTHFPDLIFQMPDLKQVDFIQRDLTHKQAAVKKIRDLYLKQLRDQGFTEEQAMDLIEEDSVGTPSGR